MRIQPEASSRRAEPDLVRGAGATAVLSLLAEGESYGYELAERLAERSEGFLDLGHATLYPLLYNLESKGLLASRRARSESGRQRKYYRLTAEGHRELGTRRADWRRLVRALTGVRVLGEDAAS